MQLEIINKRKYTYIFSAILLGASVLALSVWGLRLGIDFKGGTLMEINFNTKNDVAEETAEVERVDVSNESINENLEGLNLNSLIIQKSGENSFILRYVASDEKTNASVLTSLKKIDSSVKPTRVDFVGASISDQIRKNAIIAILSAIVAIALYIAWAFRKVSFPVPSWQYGLGAILALAHDIIITLGIFSALGYFLQIEVGIPFIAALLTILGYSVNDTIVVYDRIRENITKASSKENFENITNRSLNETIARSINTSLTVIIVLLAIIFFGGDTIKYFSIALLSGVAFGTYSSIYVASAALVTSYHLSRNN